MAPKGLKIGDTFDEADFKRVFRQKIIGIDAEGRYISECIGEVKDGELAGQFVIEEVKNEPIPVEEFIQEELPFTMPNDELVEEEQPVVEEVKKTTPKKTATKKKTTKRTAKK